MKGRLTLTLPDGKMVVFSGTLFGDIGAVSGEVVFQTGQVGYCESLTDPSYRGQILVLTYPLIGNYGVPAIEAKDANGLSVHFESDHIHLQALVVGEYVDTPSHHQSVMTLNDWLKRERVTGISGVDTRAITELVREHGTLQGTVTSEFDLPAPSKTVSWPVKTSYALKCGASDASWLLVIDCGIKNNQLRCLLELGFDLTVVNQYESFSKIRGYSGIFISNGPGDPRDYQNVISQLSEIIEKTPKIPIFGICLGHQILALTTGMTVQKMKYGNRGHNIPCKLVGTNRTFMTSQNHGYAVELDTALASDKVKVLFTNLNDGSNEGLYWTEHPWFSVQFHPEAKSGPTDTMGLFQAFQYIVVNNEHLQSSINKYIFDALGVTKPVEEPPKYRKVLVLGSGGLSIGQSGEFDYSGSQAIKAYREAGLTTILVNPNIATVQTSPGFVDKVYYVPITPEYVEQVIALERPDCIALSFGGQTALNCGSKLYYSGVLEKYAVKVLGTPIEAITLTEDRDLFKKHIISIKEKICPSACALNMEDAVNRATEIGYPVLIRAAFALGGLGSGFASDEAELRKLLATSFSVSDQVIIDRSFRGWKELEYEIVRDRHGNIICVCNMENIDPLGVHTGESIVVAPSQTLSDEDHNMLREVALKTVSSLGIVGECNIQFAVNPESCKEYYIIEVNARLSRSSALASKATGYPLAYVAAKLTLGLALDELKNSMTGTSACFEPSLDYCVVKVPRWDLIKFDMVDTHIGSAMKSVGEGMAISRSFEEALQSAIRMSGIDEYGIRAGVIKCDDDALSNPTYQRILSVASACAPGSAYDVNSINRLSGIDKWFLYAIQRIVKMQYVLEASTQPVNRDLLLEAKRLGFSDRYIAVCCKSTHVAIRDLRLSFGISPVIKRIDTVAAEFPCSTNYMYLTYSGTMNDFAVTNNPDTALVLGSGVYKIGSSVEFDWCAVNCIRELRRLGKRVIMLNCNPETVSTDYDEADVLCFTEVSLESTLDVYDAYKPGLGVVISVGGQLPNNMAMDLWHREVLVIGTQPEFIDGAENRYKFSRMLDRIQVDQPQWKELTSTTLAHEWCTQVGYPVLVRPSYVLSGAAMNVVYSSTDLDKYLGAATLVSRDHPVVISKFISGAKEIEVDAVADQGIISVLAISEHVENAGVHSGDATLIYPAQDLTTNTKIHIEKSVAAIAAELKITGPFNMQFIAKDDHILVIECNLRVSRSFPFVSKTLGVNLVAQATQIMLGKLTTETQIEVVPTRIGVKVAQFSFNRLPGADILMGVEMRSTGEVACFGETSPEAYLKALTASGVALPSRGNAILLSIGGYDAKKDFRNSVITLFLLGYQLFATHNTADYIATTCPDKPICTELSNDEILRRVSEKRFSMVVNVTERNKMHIDTVSFGYRMRRLAVDLGIPVVTDIKTAKLLVLGLSKFSLPLKIRSAIDCFTHYRTIRLPGLIDVHVHVRDFAESHKEDWTTCTRSALAGGITMICAMPNTKPPVIDQTSFDNTVAVASAKSVCDFGLISGASNTNVDTISTVNGAVALKLYLNQTHGDLQLTNTSVWIQHMQEWDSDRPICVHAEGQTLAAVLYAQSVTNKRVHVCHVSTAADIELIKMAKAAGRTVTCEVAPHHLFLSGKQPNHFSVKPPLATEEDSDALWSNLSIIDCFATDHAPHLRNEKHEGCCPGFAGLETALPLLLTAVNDGRITIEDIVLRYHTNPKHIFGLPDQPDTYVEVDPNFEHVIAERPHESRCDWTPFAGFRVKGVVKRVVLRGNVVYVADHPDEKSVVGAVIAKPGSGQLVTRQKKLEVLPVLPNAVVTQPFVTIAKFTGHFTSVDGLTKDHLRAVFKRADELRRSPNPTMLKGKRLALFFLEASTRTRVSFEAAMKNLGGDVIYVSAAESSVQKGETLEDSVRCLSGVADAVVIRHPENGASEKAKSALARHQTTMIINAGDGTNEHPTQTLVDLYTIRQEIGTLGGICVVIVGDLLNGRTVHSLAKALALRKDVIIHYVSPKHLAIPKSISDYVAERDVEQHFHLALSDEIIAAADVLYMTRLQKERFNFREMRTVDFSSEFCITPQILAKAKPTMRVLHPLPRGPEISVEIDSDSRAAYFRQMHNGLHVRMALLSLMMN